MKINKDHKNHEAILNEVNKIEKLEAEQMKISLGTNKGLKRFLQIDKEISQAQDSIRSFI